MTGFLVLFMFGGSVFSAEPTVEWVTLSAPGDLDCAYHMDMDGSGNIYVSGKAYEDSTRDDYATAKYDPDGNELWVARYDSATPPNWDDRINDMTVDVSGNVYVTGAIGTDDAYVTIKYDTDGNELWVARYDGSKAYSIAVDSSGNVYVSGYGGGGYDTIKYDQDGNEVWVAHYAGAAYGNPNDLAIDNSGNVYVTGSTYGSTSDYFTTIKYDADGNELWVENSRIGWGRSIAVDDGGNVYVTGSAYWRYMTIKYDSDGNELWVKNYNGGELFGADVATSLVVDSLGNVYVTGVVSTQIDSHSGFPIVFVWATVKYGPDGHTDWVAVGDPDVCVAEDWFYPLALTVDTRGNVFVSGDTLDGNMTTVMYDSTGDQIWTVAPVVGLAHAQMMDDEGNLIVTGCSEGAFATIKYNPPPCIDSDEDGYGNPDSYTCAHAEFDCDDDPLDDPAECPSQGGSCACGEKSCAGCAECIHPGAQEFFGDGIDSNCGSGDACATMVYEAPTTWGNIVVNLGLYLVPAGVLILGLRRRYRRQ
jgi:sugar lactone lactonase YvrE